MMRVRSVLLAVVASMAFASVAVPAAQASNGTTVPTKADRLPALTTVAVNGTAKHGKKFTGTFGIHRFVASNGNAYAYGTLKGKLNGRHVTRYGVMLPVKLTGAGNSAHAAQTTGGGSCPILHLVIGPVNLNLLGLVVSIPNPIVLDITAQPGPGNLLGNLLCDITNALNQPGVLTQLQNQLNQLVGILNSIGGLLQGLGL